LSNVASLVGTGKVSPANGSPVGALLAAPVGMPGMTRPRNSSAPVGVFDNDSDGVAEPPLGPGTGAVDWLPLPDAAAVAGVLLPAARCPLPADVDEQPATAMAAAAAYAPTRTAMYVGWRASIGWPLPGQ
jgi:hypothetical protein